jgi:hypothetical protein
VLYTAWPHLDVGFVPVAVTKGYLGVETFFVLSGFILSHVYLEATGEKRFRYGGFLWARLARVYPLHLVTLFGMIGLGLVATAAGMSIDGSLTNWRDLPAHLTLTHAWGLAGSSAFNHPSWSISAEWAAYLGFPAFAFVAWRLRDRPVLATGLAAGLALALYAAFEPLAGRGAERVVANPGAPFTLIDESYNANPISMIAGFRTLGARKVQGRRIVALTDMLELGPEGPAMHASLAGPVEDASIDLVFVAGPLMKSLWEALPATRRGGYAETAAELAPLIAQALEPGDVVMVKGSNGSRAGVIAAALAALGETGEGA